MRNKSDRHTVEGKIILGSMHLDGMGTYGKAAHRFPMNEYSSDCTEPERNITFLQRKPGIKKPTKRRGTMKRNVRRKSVRW